MRLLFTLSLTIILSNVVFAQLSCCSQILPNPGFENNVGLPTGGCTFPNVQPWRIPTTTPNPCNHPGNPSPDYYHLLGTGTFGMAGATWQGPVPPHTGSAMFGAISYVTSGERREYLSNEFSCAMVVGETYTISFWTHPSTNPNGSFYTHVGAHLSVGQLVQNSDDALNITPTFESGAPVGGTDWVFLTFTFVADQPYDHITLGNFRNDANTVTQPGPNGTGTHGYYFYDDVTVEQQTNAGTLQIDLGPDVSTCTQDPTQLDAGVVGAQYLWSTGDTTQTIPALTGGTYSVTVTTSCGSASDDVVVVSNRIPIDTFFCQGSSVTIDGTTYNSPQQNILQNTGVVDANGCPEQYDITIDELPRSTLRIDTSFCEGTSINLFGSVYRDPTTFITVSPDADENGCPADLFVNLEETTTDPVRVDTGFCPGTELVIFNRRYTTARGDRFTNPNSAGSACPNDIILQIEEYPQTQINLDTFFCEASSIELYGITFDRPRRVTVPTSDVDANGCTINVEIFAREQRRVRSTVDTFFCQGESLNAFGQFITAPGTYTQELPALRPGSCGELITINVAELPVTPIPQTASFCPGDTIELYGRRIGSAGNYLLAADDPMDVNAAGCANQYDVAVTQSAPTAATLDTFVCSGQSIELFGQQYTTDASFLQAGMDPAGNPCGRETMVTVTELFRDEQTLDTSFCFGTSVSLYGNTYSETGQEFVTEPANSALPCGRRITINLTELPENTATLDTVVCNGQQIDLFGSLRSGGDVFDVQDATPDANGCGTRLTVTVNELMRNTITLDTFFCQAEDIELFGQTYSAPQSVTVPAPVNDARGCPQDLRINLVENTAVEIPRDTFYCENESITLGSETVASPQTVRVQAPSLGPDNCPQFFLYNVVERPLRRQTLDTTICPETTIELFGQSYTGPQNFTHAEAGALPGECGLEVDVTISNFTPIPRDLDTNFCAGTTIDVFGQLYDTPGQYVQPDFLTDANNCQTTLRVSLTEDALPTASRDTSYCQGQSIELFGQTYSSPTSFVTEIASGQPDQCNTLLTTNVMETPLGTATLDTNFCEGTTIDLFGRTLAAATSFDVEVPSTVPGNCNVVLTVNLDRIPFGTANLDTSYCENQTIDLFGQTYSAPTVFDIQRSSAQPDACDEILTVSVSEIPLERRDLNVDFCSGSSVEVFGQTYDTPTSFATEQPGTPGSCNVIFNVTVTEVDLLEFTIDTFVCQGGSIDILGQTYTAATSFVSDEPPLSVDDCPRRFTVDIREVGPEPRALDTVVCVGGSISLFGETFDTPGVYQRSLPGGFGQCGIDQTITIGSVDRIAVPVDTFFCPGSVFSIFGNDFTEAGSFSAVLPPATGSDCERELFLNLREYPVVTTSVDTSFCPETTITLFGTDYTQAGLYNIGDPRSDLNGCNAFIDLELSAYPVTSYTVDIDICPGDSVAMFGQQFATAGSFQAVDQTPDANGCVQQVTVRVNELVRERITVRDEFCPGTSFAFRGELYTEAGEYEMDDVELGANGCLRVLTLDLDEKPVPMVIRDTFLCPGEVFDFRGTRATEPGTFQFVDAQGVGEACPEVLEMNLEYWPEEIEQIYDTIYIGQSRPFFGQFPTESGRYSTVRQGAGVEGCDIQVIMDLEVIPQDIYLPTAFSPNGDNINDFFYAQTEPNSIVERIDLMIIYDRWGNEVFRTSEPELNEESLGWDGRLDGKPMNPAVFVYYVAYTMVTGEERTAKGDFVLMR